MNRIAINEPITPFKSEGLYILSEIKMRIASNLSTSTVSGNEWAKVYEKTYNEVVNYVNNGVIPSNGFSIGIESFCSIFKQPVLEAVKYKNAMPEGTLEAFYAICTSSAHVSVIRSKVGCNDPVNFDRALSIDYKIHPNFSDPINSGRFGSYIVERGDSLRMPFKISIPNHSYGIANPLVIGSDSDTELAPYNMHKSILDVYESICCEGNKSFGRNVRLDVFILNNKIDFINCINTTRRRCCLNE